MNKVKMFFVSLLFIFVSVSTVFSDEELFLWHEYHYQPESQKNTNEYENKSGVVSSLNLHFVLPLEYNNKWDTFDFNYNVSATFELGYLFHLEERSGITLAAEIGYNILAVSSDSAYITRDSAYVSSIILGVTPKINIANVSLGFGGGVKLPFHAITTTGVYYTDSFDISGSKIRSNIDYTPYIKSTIDYSFFVDTKTAIVVGLDFVYNFDKGYSDLKASHKGYYLGGKAGIKFAPKI